MKLRLHAEVALLATLAVPAGAESAKARFLAEVHRIAPVAVGNESQKPEGDIITPQHSVGFSGSYGAREELFETSMRVTRNLEKMIAFNPNADVLYPGSLIAGSSLADGVLTPIAAPRTRQKCTVSDLAGRDAKAEFSDSVAPAKDTITRFINKILTQEHIAASQPARMTFTKQSFESINAAFLQLGASYSWVTGSVRGNFSTKATSVNTRLMVRFVQSYYTVSCAMDSTDPLAIFAHGTDFSQLLGKIGDGNPPAYVSSVTYGRELWMLIESNRSLSDVEGMLSAAVSLGVTNGKVDFATGDKEIVRDSTIQVFTIGGGGESAIKVITGDPSQLQSYLNEGANFSATSPGAPISYTVRYLKDNSPARVSSTQDYVIKTSQRSPVPAPLQSATATWRTTGEGKDWNTQAVVEVFADDGKLTARVACCSGDRNTDEWPNGRSSTSNLRVSAGDSANLAHGHISARAIPVRNDDWDYTVAVTLVFADGQRVARHGSGRNNFDVAW